MMIRLLAGNGVAVTVAAALAFFALAASAQSQVEPVRLNTVDLQAEAQREIANDLMNATMFSELNDADSARLANALNRAMNEALSIARKFPAVRARTGAVQTYPVYDRAQRLTGWRGRAEIRIDSRDFQAASGLVGALQPALQLGGIGFTVSPELRRQTQDELIAEAIGAFRARAEIVRKALGGGSYKIRRMSVNPQGMPGPRPQLAMARAASDTVTAPQFEGGTTQVGVAVNGSVEVE